MKIKTFCRRTGWPYDEFMDLYWSEAAEVLALYGYTLTFRFARPKSR